MDAESFHEPDKPFSQEGYALMGAAFEVHKELGGGLLEEIYQESFELELTDRRIPFTAKPKLPAYYKDTLLKKFYEPDLLVHEQIVTELKSVTQLSPAHEAQLLNYMHLSRKPVGYLINFAPIKAVEWKRLILTKFQ